MKFTKSLYNPWHHKILYHLRRGPLRWSELHRAVEPANDPALASYLKKLSRDGLIERRIVSLGPPAHIEYLLTDMGRGLADAGVGLNEWVRANQDQIFAQRQRSVAAHHAARTLRSVTIPN